MIQPIESSGGECEFCRQYPALEQDRNRSADEFASLLGGGHLNAEIVGIRPAASMIE